MNILVTGGAGYIGSHTIKKLKKLGYNVIVLDDLSTGNKQLVSGAKLIIGDIADTELLDRVLSEYKPEGVIHFAASKDAAESVEKPEKYFLNNTAKSIIFLDKLIEHCVNNVVFSSTAAVYGEVSSEPVTEEVSAEPVNPYGLSKLMIEKVLAEYHKTFGLKYISFRYFNVAGADPDGELGNLYPEPKDVTSVLMDCASTGKDFVIRGNDYDTNDGTAIRDLIHVDDLAEAHILGLGELIKHDISGIYNLGSENGYSVKEMAEATKKITGVNFRTVSGPRRDCDISISIASSAKAKKNLGWSAKHDLNDILETAWKWKQKNK